MAQSPPPQSSPFAAIAAAVQDRLATALGVSKAYLHLAATQDYPVTETEPVFAYLVFMGVGSPRDPGLSFENSGGGNLMRPIGRRLRLYLYTRSSEDATGDDTVALLGDDATQSAGSDTTPTAPGQFVREEMAFAALSDWTPLGGGGAALTIGPLHPLDSAGGPPVREPENDAGLVRSVLDFEVVYVLSIRSTEPNL